MLLSQHVQHFRRPSRIGPVVERQRDDLGANVHRPHRVAADLNDGTGRGPERNEAVVNMVVTRHRSAGEILRHERAQSGQQEKGHEAGPPPTRPTSATGNLPAPASSGDRCNAGNCCTASSSRPSMPVQSVPRCGDHESEPDQERHGDGARRARFEPRRNDNTLVVALDARKVERRGGRTPPPGRDHGCQPESEQHRDDSDAGRDDTAPLPGRRIEYCG